MKVDILPFLKEGDSSSETLMPERKNVPGRVEVAGVRGTTLAAGPFPYSERSPTFRTAGGNNPAARAALGV